MSKPPARARAKAAPRRAPPRREIRNLRFYGDTFVFDAAWGMFYRISPTAAFVLHAIDGGASREDLPDLLARHYGIDRSRAMRDAELFLNELTARGLVARETS